MTGFYFREGINFVADYYNVAISIVRISYPYAGRRMQICEDTAGHYALYRNVSHFISNLVIAHRYYQHDQ